MRGVLLTFLVAAAVLAVSCTARRTIPAGRYHEYHGPGVMLFSSRFFYFPNADSVEYEFSSDMVGSGRYGKAKYRITNRKLIMTFDGKEPLPSSLQATTKETGRDSLVLTFRITGDWLNTSRPMSGVNVVVLDAAGAMLEGAATDQDGTATLTVSHTSGPQRVRIAYIGFQSVEAPLADADASFDVRLQADPGEVYTAGKEVTFGIAEISDKQLVLKRGKDRIVFVKQ